MSINGFADLMLETVNKCYVFQSIANEPKNMQSETKKEGRE